MELPPHNTGGGRGSWSLPPQGKPTSPAPSLLPGGNSYRTLVRGDGQGRKGGFRAPYLWGEDLEVAKGEGIVSWGMEVQDALHVLGTLCDSHLWLWAAASSLAERFGFSTKCPQLELY